MCEKVLKQIPQTDAKQEAQMSYKKNRQLYDLLKIIIMKVNKLDWAMEYPLLFFIIIK